MAELDPEAEELIMTGISDILGLKDRDFKEQPLTDEEIQAVMETLFSELNKKDLAPELDYFYNRVITFLKGKVNYQ
jgi:hypothetical protein